MSKKVVKLKTLKAYDTIWHPESTLVFKSKEKDERLVIGRYENKEIIPLDDIALELCEKWSFKPDDSLMEDDEDDEGDEGDEGDSKEEENEPVVVEKHEVEKGKEQIVVEKHEVEEHEVEKGKEQIVVEEHEVEEKFMRDIRSMTEKFKTQLYLEIEFINDKLVKTQVQLENTKTQLSKKNEDMIKLQQDYDIIKKKFDTMKSLFN